jgi:propanol-preferring alcohol dehydrogenase
MVLERPATPLVEAERETPVPGPGQVRLRVKACGVCRTDLHVVDGELPPLGRPVVPGHQIVGVVEAMGDDLKGRPTGAHGGAVVVPGAAVAGVAPAAAVARLAPGMRVGVPWLGWTCGRCSFCRSGRENLCGEARFTGYHLDGGFSEQVVADARYCFPIPQGYSDAEAAPLLCAGLIGYRALVMTGEAGRLGLYGFGAAAHIVAQLARHQGRRVFAFTRAGDADGQAFARSLGAEWAGASGDAPPEPLDAAILFAPAGELVPLALRAVERGGTVVCAGIHMSDVPSFAYRLLWEERVVRSVANLTRKDGEELLALAPRAGVRTEVERFPLAAANEALARLRAGRVRGAAVLSVAGARAAVGESAGGQ